MSDGGSVGATRRSWLAPVDGLLRAEGAFAVGHSGIPFRALAVLLVCGGVGYGAVMGARDLRVLQVLYSGLKVPLLLGVSSLVCLPSFFVLNTVLGLRDDFEDAIRGVVAAQATVAVVLASFAPLTAFLYVQDIDYDTAILANGVVFLIAALGGQWTLGRHYSVLIRRNPRHRLTRAAWLTLYAFVAIQAAWVLRPFIGTPNQATRFFREEAWSNAYVVVVELIWDALVG